MIYTMKTAKLFRNGRSQAIRLPSEFRFEGTEVYVRRDPATGDVILSRRPESWKSFFELMKTVEVARRLPDRSQRHVTAKAQAVLDARPLSSRHQHCQLRDKGQHPRVRERLLKVPMAEVGISVVTEAELRFGVARLAHAPSLKVAVEEFLLHVEVLPWDSNCALHYANLRAEVERRGEPMGNLDMMIAAQALALGVTLVTNDRVFRG